MISFEIALEMMEALNSDNEMSIISLGENAEEIAQVLYEYIINGNTHNK